MPAVIPPLKRFISEYGNAVLLALLVHGLILAILLTMSVRQHIPLPQAEPITSFLYQPPLQSPPAVIKPTAEADIPEIVNASPEPPAPLIPTPDGSFDIQTAVSPPQSAAENNARQSPIVTSPAAASETSLAQRALNQVIKPDQAVIEQAATASYQQFLQQQQPRLTVDKQHWPLSQNPAQLVIAQLNDGRQIIRIEGGCRIADPTLDGFEALMALKYVPCGDEIKTTELLKQALDKHNKR